MEAVLNRMQFAAGGFIISLAVVFGGSASFAEGLTGFGGTGQGTSLIDGISDADLQALEHANAADATAARLAAMGVDAKGIAPVRSRSADRGDEKPVADTEVFRHSGHVLSLLVPRADAIEADVASMRPVKLRPGLVQPVGVSPALVRAPMSARPIGD